MTDHLGKFGLITFIIAVLALLAWGEYERDWMLTTAFITSGVGLLAGAVEIVLAQRGQPLKGVGRWYEEWGIALYPWSFVLLFIGLGLLSVGVVRALGMSASFSSYLSRRPGVALIVGGLIMASSGAATVIGPISWRDSPWDLLLRLPARLLGGLMVIVGLAAVILGLFESVSPLGFDQWLTTTLGPFAPDWP